MASLICWNRRFPHIQAAPQQVLEIGVSMALLEGKKRLQRILRCGT